MNTLLPWLLKMMLCSALLYGYYLLALRNRVFHQWNRFYLLAIVPLSLLLPLVRIDVMPAPATTTPALPVQLLEVVSTGHSYIETFVPARQPGLTWEQAVYSGYATVVLLMLFALGRALLRLRKLSQTYPAQDTGNVKLYMAPVAGTPFSHFRNIFWNPAIDLQSENGQRILRHELAHVHEGHSLDKLLLQITLAFFWFNPVFWILRRELHLIHEFIADRKAVDDGETSTLAVLILAAAFPEKYGMLTNSFFHKAIKRRLHMLNQSQKTKARYIGRILVLPLLAGLALLLALRQKANAQDALIAAPAHSAPFTVVIDAGHGKNPDGSWNGAFMNVVAEDEITLKLARLIQRLNGDPSLRIVMTRTDDNHTDLRERVAIAERSAADLFISLHLDAAAPDRNGETTLGGGPGGIGVFLSRDSSRREKSKIIGTLLQQELTKTYRTRDVLLRRFKSAWVLDQSPCPAVMVEFGYITNSDDFAFVRKAGNQEKLARAVLNAINTYRASLDNQIIEMPDPRMPDKQPTRKPLTDTVDKPPFRADVQSVDVYSDGTVELTYRDGRTQKSSSRDLIAKGVISPAVESIVDKVMEASDPGGSNTLRINRNTPAGKEGTLPIDRVQRKPLFAPRQLIILNGKPYADAGVLLEELEQRYGWGHFNGELKGKINKHESDDAVKKYGYAGRNGALELAFEDEGLPVLTQLLHTDFEGNMHVLLKDGARLQAGFVRNAGLKNLLAPRLEELTQARLKLTPPDGRTQEVLIENGRNSQRARALLRTVQPGTGISITDRVEKLADGSLRGLPSLTYVVQ